MEPAAGTVIAEKYRLESPLARGGMGSVWTGRHVALGSQVAVKFVDKDITQDPIFLVRFEREARAAAAIQSPHVVHVQDFGVQDGTPYLVMELLHGEDLRARLRRIKRLSMADTARIVVQVGKALRRAHGAGIVHRDLKPANVYLAQMEDEEIVKILDFGIAKETDGPEVGESTKTGEVFGSPHYMSPEQARADKDIDTRADLWSLGVLIFRMLTGKLPFEGEVMGAILSRMLVDPPPAMRDVAPDLPETLDAFFAQALAKKREERFQNVRALVAAFLEATGTTAQMAAEHTAAGLDLHAILSMRTGSLPDLGLAPGQPSMPAIALPPHLTSHLTPVSHHTPVSQHTPVSGRAPNSQHTLASAGEHGSRPPPLPGGARAEGPDSASGRSKASNAGDPALAGARDDGAPVESASTSRSVSSLVKSVSPDEMPAPSRKPRWLIGAAAVVVLGGGAIAVLASRGGDGAGAPAAAETASAAPSAVSPAPSSAGSVAMGPQAAPNPSDTMGPHAAPNPSAPSAPQGSPSGASDGSSAASSAVSSASSGSPASRPSGVPASPSASASVSAKGGAPKGGKGPKKPTDWGF